MIGAPSKGILILKICWSLMIVEREVRTVFGSAELSAESASLFDTSALFLVKYELSHLFLGSCKSWCSHSSTAEIETAVHGALNLELLGAPLIAFSSTWT